MVIVAVLMGTLVLFGFVALATDGGSLLLQRRNMQNAADAAAIGAVKYLSENVVWGPDPADSTNKPIYVVTDGQLKDLIRKLAESNGIKAGVGYVIRLEYGYFDDVNCFPYCWTIPGAVNTDGVWVPTENHNPIAVVPAQVDAVRITAQIEYPTTFARIIGWNSITANAVSAAALVGDPNHILKGPTWPMTSRIQPGQSTADYLNVNGLCNPVRFYKQDATFQNLISLSAAQGCSFTQDRVYGGDCSSVLALHAQLIQWNDARRDPQGNPGFVDQANLLFGARNNQSVCNSPNGWFPQGSCSGTHTPEKNIFQKYGTICCRNTSTLDIDDLDVSDIDVANWIYWDFFGPISPETSVFPGGSGPSGENRWRSLDPLEPMPEDYRSSAYPPNDEDKFGDWLETYLNSNRVTPNQVIGPVQNYIARNGSSDALSSALSYGQHVDKTMYLYRDAEIWERGNPIPGECGGPGPPPEPECPYEWQAAADDEAEPGRVHIVQPLKFRFYSALAQNLALWSFNLHALCSTTPPTNPAPAVYAIIVGEVLDQPPNFPSAHGMYNYVGFVDPN